MVSLFFIKCPNQDFTRGCYNRLEAWGLRSWVRSKHTC
jgi:hypothetical protein